MLLHSFMAQTMGVELILSCHVFLVNHAKQKKLFFQPSFNYLFAFSLTYSYICTPKLVIH